MQNTAEILEFPNENLVSHLGIEIDLSKDKKLTEQARKLLMEYYCREDEPSPQYAYARAAVAYSYGDIELAQRIYNYVSDNWFMYSSPVLSNAPLKVVVLAVIGAMLERYLIKLPDLCLFYTQ